MMKIEKIHPRDWVVLSENVHAVVFGKEKPAHFDRIDYALLALDEKTNLPLGYLTARELDHESVYWQFGGTFPGTRGSTTSWQVYLAMIRWTKEKYKRILTYVENTNTAYLKFAMKAGFKITGIRNAHGTILLEHVLEFEGGK